MVCSHRRLWAGALAYRVSVANSLDNRKGVICAIRPRSLMPRTKHGVPVDIIIYGGSTIRRSNFGRFYEHFYNACSRDLLFRLREYCGLPPQEKPTTAQLKAIANKPELIQYCWEKLTKYFSYWAPVHLELVQTQKPVDYVLHVLADDQHMGHGITVHVPVNNPVNLLDTIRQLKDSEFAPHYDKLILTDEEGNQFETESDILVGALPIFLLEKIGEDWSGVASARTQQFGLPAKSGGADAKRTPGSENAKRVAGESETRSYIATIGPDATVEIQDQTNNPLSHREVVRTLFKTETPSNVPVAVPRDVVPYGGSRPVSLMDHLLECRGIAFTYKPGE